MLRQTNRLNRIVLTVVILALVAAFGYSIQYASSPNLTTPGNVWAWGANQGGQLGDPDSVGDAAFSRRETPKGIQDRDDASGFLTGAINAAGGNGHTLALKSDRTISAVGANGSGQLGNGDSGNNASRNSPVKVLNADRSIFTGVSVVAAGAQESFAVKTDGTLWAWGNNGVGQLGTRPGFDGAGADTEPHPFPEQVRINPNACQPSDMPSCFLTGVRAVDGGSLDGADPHSIAVRTDGTLWAWGRNIRGSLGNISIVSPSFSIYGQAVPVETLNTNGQPQPLRNVTAAAASYNFGLAVREDRTVWAWGRNSEGQLGLGQAGSPQQTAVQIPNLSNVVAVDAGVFHGLAIKNDGTVWAWGDNSLGQLGTGDNNPRLIPTQVNISDVIAIAAGIQHSVALKRDGTVWAWGDNDFGQLGISRTVSSRNVPVMVGDIRGVALIAVGGNFSLALKPDNITGRVTNSQQQGLRDITITQSGAGPSAMTRTNINGHYALGTVERNQTYVVTPDNSAITFVPVNRTVQNLAGNQTADFTTLSDTTAVSISGRIRDLNQQSLSGLTVTLSDGGGQLVRSVQTDSQGGYLFDGLTRNLTYRVAPVEVSEYTFDPLNRAYTPLTESVMNQHFTASLKEFSDPEEQSIVWTWGQNSSGQLAYSTMNQPMNVPQAVTGLVGVVPVVGGTGHSLGLRLGDRRVVAWGRNGNGQLGNDTFRNSVPPVLVSNLTDATKIAAGFAHSLARREGGTVMAWGRDDAGELGNGIPERDLGTPSPVVTESGAALSNIIEVSAGFHSLALRADGTVWSWGNNNNNALGSVTFGTRNTAFRSHSPSAVPVDDNLTNVIAIAAGRHHSLALRQDGTVWAWGRNCEGQLGRGDTQPCFDPSTQSDLILGQLRPVQVTGLSNNIVAIAAGFGHSLALTRDGTVFAWGDNDRGQLGDGTRTDRSSPVQVLNLSGVRAIAAGDNHSLALRQTQTSPSDGTVFAWGSNEFGQLGNGSMTGSGNDSPVPVQAMGLTGVTSIGAGGNHSLATVETKIISGRITQDGAPLAGVNVTLSGSPTTITQTDGNGIYRFRNLTIHGDYIVTPSRSGFAFRSVADTLAFRSFTNLTGNQTAVDFVATPQANAPSAASDIDVLRISNDVLAQGTLSQERPVLDTSINPRLENGRITITPATGANSERFSGFVTRGAFDFLNRGVSVRVERTADDTGETIFSVGSDKDTWVRFIVMETAAAAAKGFIASGDDIGATGSGKQAMGQKKSGANSPVQTIVSVPYDSAAHAHMNISNANGMAVFSTSADGMKWTALAATAAPPSSAPGSPSAAELGAGTSSPAAQPGSAVFSALSVGTAAASPTTMQFERANFPVGEGDARASVTITRSGVVTGESTVEYRTIDDPAEIRCDDTTTRPNVAFARCDYATTIDTVRFAAGETSKTFTIPIIDDAHTEGDEVINLELLTTTGGGKGELDRTKVTIAGNDANPGPNPVLTVPFFVRQNYLDFLSREPEQGEPWSAILNNCPDQFNTDPNSPSARCDRLLVSESFFGSPEFRLKGFYAFIHYRVAFPERFAEYAEIVADLRAVTGVTPPDTFARRALFPVNFVARQEFRDRYEGLSPQQYVDTLLNRYGLQQITTPDPAVVEAEGTTRPKVTLTRNALVDRLNGVGGALTRAQVLRAIVESDEVSRAEFNRAFVAMQYYGYLRRKPEPDGYQGWLNYLSANPTDSRTMVNGFMNSVEYRLRFGRP